MSLFFCWKVKKKENRLPIHPLCFPYPSPSLPGSPDAAWRRHRCLALGTAAAGPRRSSGHLLLHGNSRQVAAASRSRGPYISLGGCSRLPQHGVAVAGIAGGCPFLPTDAAWSLLIRCPSVVPSSWFGPSLSSYLGISLS